MKDIQYPVFGTCPNTGEEWEHHCPECHGELAYKGTRTLQVTWLQWVAWEYLGFCWGLPRLTDDFGGHYDGVREA